MVAGSVSKGKPVEEDRTEVRNSPAYIDAYANYIKTGDASECRSLLTANAGVSITGEKLPVPEFLQEKIETAWEKNEILNRVNKTFLAGNIKVPFELSADDAIVHAEGSGAVAEEELTFGMVELKPETIKKWVSFSDEVQAMKGRAFLEYIGDELVYRVIKKLADRVLDDITTAPAANSATAIGVPAVTMNPAVTTIPEAAAHLSEYASNLVVIMNRLTEVEFTKAFAAGNFAVNPFEGVTKVYSNHLPAFSTATNGAVYAIVGDLYGMQVNYPEGEGVETKWDNLTRKKEDIVEVLGRQFAAHGVTKLGHFATLKKAAASAGNS
jgi:HK97 family phage major capsid protein